MSAELLSNHCKRSGLPVPTAAPTESWLYPRTETSSSSCNTCFTIDPLSTETNSDSDSQSAGRDANLLIQTYLSSADEILVSSGCDEQAYTEEPFVRPSRPNLSLPLCIPQTSIGASFDSAFARGYSDALQDVGISEEMWLDFVDGLNLAIVSSPPLRVVDAAGQALGLLPWDWAIASSFAIVTATQTTMRVASKRLADKYLRTANSKIFHLRGLSARLCTTRAMLTLLGRSAEIEGPKKTKTKKTLYKVGRRVGTLVLLTDLSITSRIVRDIADKPPVISPIPGETTDRVVLRRRLTMVSGSTLPLRTEGLLPPKKPQGVVDMMNNWSLEFDKKLDLKRENSSTSTSTATSFFSESPDKREADEAKKAKKEAKRIEREIRIELKARCKAERKAAKLEKENELRSPGIPFIGHGGFIDTPMRRRVANADLMEHWANEDILWLVLMNSELDNTIMDIDVEDPHTVQPEEDT
ncbi:hypothetical protein K435DRAFT_789668 [Dendrothele bispora CBS 962.96]|uniref:Uncharacterized protein n=1 Tax=Dendrothele bispora (strain CBS 962.96) TaxID=1314807 RepID=A0A4S8MU92_DENBC|nr:hypothetical protein K435DRAFT_789668 [Dendrothele bispora CBS 962.96]